MNTLIVINLLGSPILFINYWTTSMLAIISIFNVTFQMILNFKKRFLQHYFHASPNGPYPEIFTWAHVFGLFYEYFKCVRIFAVALFMLAASFIFLKYGYLNILCKMHNVFWFIIPCKILIFRCFFVKRRILTTNSVIYEKHIN